VTRLDHPDRLAAVHATGLLDTPAEPCFDRLTRLASEALGAPVAQVSLIEDERQFFKSAHGLELSETPLSHSLCRHVVIRDAPLVVEDLRADETLRDEPAVTELGVAAYAGVPLRDHDGVTIGAFCALGTEPRPWTEAQVQTLHEISALATAWTARCS